MLQNHTYQMILELLLFRPFDLFSGEAKFNLTDGDESVQKDFFWMLEEFLGLI